MSDGGFLDNQAITPLVRRGCEKIIALDATSDPSVDMQGWKKAKFLLSKYGWELDDPKEIHEDKRIKSAWAMGSHIWKTRAKKDSAKGGKSEITILKLGMSTSDIGFYSSDITRFARLSYDSRDWSERYQTVRLEDLQSYAGCNGVDGFEKRCAFPLEDTVRQSYEQVEFRAYRMLGRHMACDFALMAMKKYGEKSTISGNEDFCEAVRSLASDSSNPE